MNVVLSECTWNIIYLVLFIFFIWFIYPIVKCIFKPKCRKEHLVPLFEILTNFSGKPKDKKED